MAKINVGTSSELLYKSVEGTASNPDNVAIRLSDGSGKVYIEQRGTASTTTSFYIQDTDIFSVTMVAGDYINAIVASGSEDVLVTAPPTGVFGS